MVNSHFSQNIFFKEKTLALIPSLDAKGFEKALAEHLDRLHKLGVQFKLAPDHTSGGDGRDFLIPPSEKFSNQIRITAARLAKAFQAGLSNEKRREAFVQLKDVGLFREVGAGFLISLLPKDQLEDSIYYRLVLSAKDKDDLKFEFGKNSNRELYDTLIYIQSVINNRSIDLRQLREENKQAPEQKDNPASETSTDSGTQEPKPHQPAHHETPNDSHEVTTELR